MPRHATLSFYYFFFFFEITLQKFSSTGKLAEYTDGNITIRHHLGITLHAADFSQTCFQLCFVDFYVRREITLNSRRSERRVSRFQLLHVGILRASNLTAISHHGVPHKINYPRAGSSNCPFISLCIQS